jgi:hypothetical protein
MCQTGSLMTKGSASVKDWKRAKNLLRDSINPHEDHGCALPLSGLASLVLLLVCSNGTLMPRVKRMHVYFNNRSHLLPFPMTCLKSGLMMEPYLMTSYSMTSNDARWNSISI